jgi:hypothetical protein
MQCVLCCNGQTWTPLVTHVVMATCFVFSFISSITLSRKRMTTDMVGRNTRQSVKRTRNENNTCSEGPRQRKSFKRPTHLRSVVDSEEEAESGSTHNDIVVDECGDDDVESDGQENTPRADNVITKALSETRNDIRKRLPTQNVEEEGLTAQHNELVAQLLAKGYRLQSPADISPSKAFM